MKVNGGGVGNVVVSRPASPRERPGSRVASGAAPQGVCTGPSSPTSHLDARTNDNTNPQVSTSDLNDDHFKEDEQRTSEITALWESTDGDAKAVDIEDMDRELQEAMDETNRLDAVLAVLQLKVKLLKLQGKELRKQLWEELMSLPKSVEYPGEAENTRLFLALEAPLELEVEADFEPVFETQPPDENELTIGHKEEQSQNNVRRLTKSCEEDQEKGQEPPHLSHSDAAQGKKQQDFVKKNIELAGATGDLVLMTPAEKDRLAELLRDIDEEFGQEDGHTAGERGDSEGDAWAVSLRPGEGFAPDAAQLELLRYIDFRLNLLSSAEDSSSVRSSLDGSMSRGPGSDAGWELGEDDWTGGGGDAGYETEEGLADLASPREAAAAQDARLVVSQEMASLGEEQLRGLLDECELSQIGRPEPPPSEALLAALLRDPYTTSFTPLGPNARDT